MAATMIPNDARAERDLRTYVAKDASGTVLGTIQAPDIFAAIVTAQNSYGFDNVRVVILFSKVP